RLAALFVVLDELVDLPADDLPLVGLLARGDSPLQQVPVDLRAGAALAAANRRVPLVPVAEHFETDELVDVPRSQRCLIELHAELLHADGRDVDHDDAPHGWPGRIRMARAGAGPPFKSRDCIPRRSSSETDRVNLRATA